MYIYIDEWLAPSSDAVAIRSRSLRLVASGLVEVVFYNKDGCFGTCSKMVRKGEDGGEEEKKTQNEMKLNGQWNSKNLSKSWPFSDWSPSLWLFSDFVNRSKFGLSEPLLRATSTFCILFFMSLTKGCVTLFKLSLFRSETLLGTGKETFFFCFCFSSWIFFRCHLGLGWLGGPSPVCSQGFGCLRQLATYRFDVQRRLGTRTKRTYPTRCVGPYKSCVIEFVDWWRRLAAETSASTTSRQTE